VPFSTILRDVAGTAETLSEEADARISTRGRPAPGLVLVYSEGTPRLRAALLPPAGLEIGRGVFGGMPLDDQRLSSRHVRVAWSGGGWSIADLESHNGTYVDGRRVTGEATFERARVLRAGRTLFLLESDVRRFVGASVERDGDALVGPTLLGAWREIERAARSGDVLLLTGESGAGKDLAARAFHARAGARGPFVAVNCAAIPQGLAERLLFGTRRGAYSGATEDADGYVQAADGGTLFLDEVADLDAAVQPKLLRAIEAKEIVPLGASRPRRVDVRVCSAAHDLRRAVAEGRFREDLYFRIGRPEVSIPPLRERCEEIPWLLAAELDRARPGLTAAPALVEACMLRPWPGNVRELLSETRRMAGAVGDRDTVGLEDLARDAGAELPRAAARPGAARDLPDDATIEKTLREHEGNVTGAARTLGMHRNQIRRWIAKRRAPDDRSE
jgi:transcriptional regulator with PAS, ATPase and Fis domain